MSVARVYIGNLPADTEFLDVYNICVPYGQILVIEMQDTAAFVNFNDSGNCEHLIQAYNGVLRSILFLKPKERIFMGR